MGEPQNRPSQFIPSSYVPATINEPAQAGLFTDIYSPSLLIPEEVWSRCGGCADAGIRQFWLLYTVHKSFMAFQASF